MARTYLIVAIGAIFGATSRFFFTHISSELSSHHGFPYGTLFVNVLGSLFAGYVLEHTPGDNWRLFLVVGFCGAFTTFSTFAWETIAYVREGHYGLATLNVVGNNLLCLGSIVAGVFIARLRMS